MLVCLFAYCQKSVIYLSSRRWCKEKVKSACRYQCMTSLIIFCKHLSPVTGSTLLRVSRSLMESSGIFKKNTLSCQLTILICLFVFYLFVCFFLPVGLVVVLCQELCLVPGEREPMQDKPSLLAVQLTQPFVQDWHGNVVRNCVCTQ